MILNYDHGLTHGDTITNQQLTEIFKCGPQGGMRRSLTTNTLVVVSDHTKSMYEDRWIDNTMHYTGMGTQGDQSLEFAQNRTLSESQTTNIEVFLFEVFERGQYTFVGQVQLAKEPYQEEQVDINGELRQVWIFPLCLKDGDSIVIPESKIQIKRERKEREARRLDTQELKNRAIYSRKGIGMRIVAAKVYERNPYVAELAKRNANGDCQLCEDPAPFMDMNGNPFLEAHHIKWLSQGGDDIIENTVALCPNCHRKMHNLNLEADKDNLRMKIQNYMV